MLCRAEAGARIWCLPGVGGRHEALAHVQPLRARSSPSRLHPAGSCLAAGRAGARSQVEHVMRQAHPAAEARGADGVLAYRLQTLQVRYVDTHSLKHSLGMGDVLGAVLDPLGAPGSGYGRPRCA